MQSRAKAVVAERFDDRGEKDAFWWYSFIFILFFMSLLILDIFLCWCRDSWDEINLTFTFILGKCSSLSHLQMQWRICTPLVYIAASSLPCWYFMGFVECYDDHANKENLVIWRFVFIVKYQNQSTIGFYNVSKP